MKAFDQQDQAQRRTRWLLALFGLAVLLIVGAMGGSVEVIAWTMGVTAGLIVLASVYRAWQLRAGGGGSSRRRWAGAWVDGNPADPQWRQLRNVVEEMEIASGVPVPEVYVLDQLDALRMRDKDHLIRAVVATASHGGLVVATEVELLRVMAASLHVPRPQTPEGISESQADALGFV